MHKLEIYSLMMLMYSTSMHKLGAGILLARFFHLITMFFPLTGAEEQADPQERQQHCVQGEGVHVWMVAPPVLKHTLYLNTASETSSVRWPLSFNFTMRPVSQSTA